MSNERYEYFNPATGCEKCPALASQRHTIVWGRGPANADIMMLGEAPGYHEDQEGKPFIGAAGRQLDQILKKAGLSIAEVHIGNMIMCRPPGNRDPEQQELENCEPWLVQHIRSVNPKAIILFGQTAIASRFDKHTVKDTLGLMYREDCDSCGKMAHEHLDRWAADGEWKQDTFGYCQKQEFVRRRLYASVYHPAAKLHSGIDYVPQIVHQIERVIEELKA